LGLALDEANSEDQIYEVDGIEFLISPRDKMVIGETKQLTIDFSNSGWQRGFIISRSGWGNC
jgi:Fe-S cluster assembly iron-binding protein IscA